MKVLVLSNDENLSDLITKEIDWDPDLKFVIRSESSPIELLSLVCQERPVLLVFDDDLVRPDSAQVLRNIRKLHEDIKIIFVTSDSSLEIGRSVSQLGVQYYAIKPIEIDDFRDSVLAIISMTKKNAIKHKVN